MRNNFPRLRADRLKPYEQFFHKKLYLREFNKFNKSFHKVFRDTLIINKKRVEALCIYLLYMFDSESNAYKIAKFASTLYRYPFKIIS